MSNADRNAPRREPAGAGMQPEHANVDPSIVRESSPVETGAAHPDPSTATPPGTGSGASSGAAGTETPAG